MRVGVSGACGDKRSDLVWGDCFFVWDDRAARFKPGREVFTDIYVIFRMKGWVRPILSRQSELLHPVQKSVLRRQNHVLKPFM